MSYGTWLSPMKMQQPTTAAGLGPGVKIGGPEHGLRSSTEKQGGDRGGPMAETGDRLGFPCYMCGGKLGGVCD